MASSFVILIPFKTAMTESPNFWRRDESSHGTKNGQPIHRASVGEAFNWRDLLAIAHHTASQFGTRDGSVNGPGAVKGERTGLSPLAVQKLAEEFRRLAAEDRKGLEELLKAQPLSGAFINGRVQMAELAASRIEELNG